MEMIVIVGWLVCAALGGIAGAARESSGAGFALALFCGPLGLLVALVVDFRQQCPECRGRVGYGAKVCAWCRLPLAWRDEWVMTEARAAKYDADQAAQTAAPQAPPVMHSTPSVGRRPWGT